MRTRKSFGDAGTDDDDDDDDVRLVAKACDALGVHVIASGCSSLGELLYLSLVEGAVASQALAGSESSVPNTHSKASEQQARDTQARERAKRTRPGASDPLLAA